MGESSKSRGWLQPVRFEAKEGLAIVNSTAFSGAAAALPSYGANGPALLSQALTAMSQEALQRKVGSFDPLYGRVRTQPGQIEVYLATLAKLIVGRHQ